MMCKRNHFKHFSSGVEKRNRDVLALHPLLSVEHLILKWISSYFHGIDDSAVNVSIYLNLNQKLLNVERKL